MTTWLIKCELQKMHASSYWWVCGQGWFSQGTVLILFKKYLTLSRKLFVHLAFSTCSHRLGMHYDPTLASMTCQCNRGNELQAVYFTCNGAYNSSAPLAGQSGTLPLDGNQYNYTLTFPSMPQVSGCATSKTAKNKKLVQPFHSFILASQALDLTFMLAMLPCSPLAC